VVWWSGGGVGEFLPIIMSLMLRLSWPVTITNVMKKLID
jgi:hypothetical protein